MSERIPDRNIFGEPPKSWQDLQNYVAQTFREMGCDAATTVTKELPRGEVEFDVVVEDPTTHIAARV